MPLPSLTGWDSTRKGLQWASRVVGAFRVADLSAQPHDLQYSLEVTERGLTTGPLDSGVELALPYDKAVVDYAELAAADNPEAMVARMLDAVHGLFVPRMEETA